MVSCQMFEPPHPGVSGVAQVLFMTSAYILFLNPLILSGAASGTITGMPRDDVVLATAISTGITLALKC